VAALVSSIIDTLSLSLFVFLSNGGRAAATGTPRFVGYDDDSVCFTTMTRNVEKVREREKKREREERAF
jgi:hypothetical protein